MDFPPILILVILWLLISLPLSKIKKAGQGQQAARTGSAPGARQPEKQPHRQCSLPGLPPVKDPRSGRPFCSPPSRLPSMMIRFTQAA